MANTFCRGGEKFCRGDFAPLCPSCYGPDVRYADEGKNYTKILAIIRDSEAKHSSKFLTQLVKDLLQDNGIQKDHVLCIVTANASSMVNMIKQLNERPREGSNTTEESAVEIQEQSGLVTATN